MDGSKDEGWGEPMQIVVYRITGQQGMVRIPQFVCRECDLTVAAVQAACSQAGVPESVLTVKPWIPHLRQAWSEGAHHPPAVLVNGKLYSQEVVPEVNALAENLRREWQRELSEREGMQRKGIKDES